MGKNYWLGKENLSTMSEDRLVELSCAIQVLPEGTTFVSKENKISKKEMLDAIGHYHTETHKIVNVLNMDTPYTDQSF